MASGMLNYFLSLELYLSKKNFPNVWAVGYVESIDMNVVTLE